ncbi:helix-turn-helix transcriptional regulator [candidate division WOR-3 bacterium]|nr:helix-turn-helix transcriptional regulator [candidate division WOR-3 bacterium]
MDKSAIHKRIRQVREKLGFTLREFAEKLGCTVQAVWNYENRRLPPYDMLIKISELGGVSIDWLLKGEEPKRTDSIDILWEETPDLMAALKDYADAKRKERAALERIYSLLKPKSG